MGPALVAAAQDHAVPRGGGSSSGSSSAGEHHSGGEQSSSSGSSSSSSDHSGSSGSSSAPISDAERRHPRPGTGTGDHFVRGGGGYYYGSPYYYGRQYYYDLYDPFYYGAYGYSPFYYSGSYGYAPSYYRGRYRDGGSLRVIVDPDKTRVYVDGYYAGIADDFDGIFQRLYVPPGRHEIMLKLEGYRTHRFRVFVPVDETIKIHHVMERGAGEDTDEVVGDPAEYQRHDERDRYDERDRGRDRGRDDQRYERRDRDQDNQAEDERDDADAGTLRLDVRPADASVYVDGEFRGSGRRGESLRLAPGHHRVEVVRPGYRTVERDVEVRPGETKSLEIDLGR